MRDALGQVRELLDGQLPYLPELPERGPGADLIGRTAGLLVELPVDLQPVGWRLVDRPGRDAQRTAAFLREDLDELAEAFDGHTGPLKLQVDPSHPEVAEELVEWFEEVSDAEQQSALVMEGDVTEQALAAAGFAPQDDSPYMVHHVLDLDDLPPAPAVEGYAMRHVETHEARQRAAVHAAAWSDDAPSRVDERAYTQLMDAWPYRADLDWVATDAAGDMVASALIWLDPATGAGLVEPVGCVPEHRGRGLAGAVTLAALHHLRSVGGTVAQVTPRGDDDYPGPQRLYQSLGFRPVARTVTWTRSLE